jgi:hypothetical protein
MGPENKQKQCIHTLQSKIQRNINQKRQRNYFICIKGTTHQGDITIVNFGSSNFIKQILLDIKPQIDTNTSRVGEFNTLL